MVVVVAWRNEKEEKEEEEAREGSVTSTFFLLSSFVSRSR
jgi:hypothetical protein